MKYTLQILTIASISFIGPNSQARLSNTEFSDMNHHGYRCKLGYQRRQINIHYYNHPMHNIACDISYQKNYHKQRKIWAVQRNHFLCETKVSSIVQKFKDRGWQCQVTGINTTQKDIR